MFSSGANVINFSTAGVERGRFTATGEFNLVSLGTAALPAYSFTTDPDTGIYSSAANTLNVTLAGAEVARFTTGQFLLVDRGTAAAPAFTFTLDADTGMFSSGANVLNFATTGVERARFTAAGEYHLVAGGTAAAPAIALTGDTNTGIAWTAADTLVLSTGGTARLTIDSAGKVTIPGVLDPTAVVLSGGTALFFESSDGSTAPLSAVGSGRIRFLAGTGWQTSSDGGAYTTLAAGLSGGGAATQVAHWSGAATLTGTGGFTFDSADLRLTVSIVQLGANVTPATGDIWFATPFLNYRTGAGTQEVVAAGITQTITGQKNFSTGPIFSDATFAFQCQTQAEFNSFGSPTAVGRFSRSGPDLLFHTGGGVVTILNSGNGFAQSGNSFGAPATFGTNDAFSLSLETNNVARVTIGSAGNLDIVSGDFRIGGTTVFEADRDFAIDLIPNADDAFQIGSIARRIGGMIISSSVQFLNAASDANPTAVYGSDILMGAGGASAPDLRLRRSAATTWTADDGAAGAITFSVVGAITLTGTINFADDVRVTFNPGATVAGLNVGSQAGNPSTPINGDIWYDSTSNELKARVNGATVVLA
jgi:hypothetical protein